MGLIWIRNDIPQGPDPFQIFQERVRYYSGWGYKKASAVSAGFLASFSTFSPSFAGSDRRISFCQGRKGPVLPLVARKMRCQGQNGVLLPLGSSCQAQKGVLVCPGRKKKNSRAQKWPLACPAASKGADKCGFLYKVFLYSLGVTPFIRKKKRPKVVESA